MLLGGLRICSCLGLRLLGPVSTAVLGPNALLLVQDHLLNSLVLSLVCYTARGLVSLLQHACHYIVIGSFNPQVVIRSLIFRTNSRCSLLHPKRFVITIPGGVTLNIIYNFFHLEHVSWLLKPTRG